MKRAGGKRLAWVAFVARIAGIAVGLGCGGRTGLSTPSALEVAACHDDPPECVRAGADVCAAPERVAVACESTTRAWRCPEGARLHARVPSSAATCLPFHSPGGPIRALGGSLVRVPTDDGRCLWIADEVTTADGRAVRNVALTPPDLSAPFGTCPSAPAAAASELSSAVYLESGDDPSIVVSITGAYRVGGSTRVTYRLFRHDETAGFGLRLLGSGLGRWDAATSRVVVPSAAELRFGPDLDLGDASVVESGTAYLWGCPGPPSFLTERCLVARLDGRDALELFAGDGHWVASTRGSDGATVFDAGPWVSSVVRDSASGGLLHVFAVGFGSDLQTHAASRPEGPWSVSSPLARCDLPATDPQAFCAGPVVHPELRDPTRPRELVVSYGVGTTATDGAARRRADPGAYWTRLVRLDR